MTTATLPAAPTRVTPEELLERDDNALYELVNGQLVEKTMSSLANETSGIVGMRLGNYSEKAKAGKHYPEQTYQCFPLDSDLVRRPDVSFVVKDRLSGVSETGHVRIAPDLAVEVISPNDKVYELGEKLDNYRSAKVGMIWVIDPKHRWIHVHQPGRPMVELRDGDTLNADPILPGFSIDVKDLLPQKL